MLKKLKSPHVIFSSILFLSGMAILLYPFVSNLVASQNASQVVEAYEEEVSSMEAEKIDAAKEAAKKYNEQLSDVISVEEEAKQEENNSITYLDMVDAGMSLGYIVIPSTFCISFLFSNPFFFKRFVTILTTVGFLSSLFC